MIYGILLGTAKTAIFLAVIGPCLVFELFCFFAGIGDGFVTESAWEWFKKVGIRETP